MASKKLAQVFRLLRLLGDEIELFQLGQPLDQNADVAAEQAVDLGASGIGILDRVVQQRRRDGRVVELQIGEDRSDLQRVGEIGIARRPLLLAMRAHGIDVRAVEQILVGGRVVLLDPVDQLELPHHLRLAALWRRLDVLRHEIWGARDRDPQPGLVLHPRQIDRRARHKNLGPAAKAGGGCHKDIMAQAQRHKARRAPGRPADQSRRPLQIFRYRTPPFLASASRMSARSRDGVTGSVSIRTPSGRSASSIAQASAGGATMRPPSPAPLTPYSV